MRKLDCRAVVRSGLRYLILFALLLVIFSAFVVPPAARADIPAQVTIKLFESHAASNRLNVEGPFRIVQPNAQSVPAGKYFFEDDGHTISLRSAFNSRSFNLNAKRFSLTSDRGIAMQYSTSKPRRYKGTINISNERGCLEIRNLVSSRDYVMSVVGSESNVGFPLESLKAQTILTLTRVYRLRPGEIIGDSTQAESYFGSDYVSPLVQKAVGAVWGQIVTYHGQPVQVFYHSTCAGGTSEAVGVFGAGASNLPYYKCVPCRFCQSSPFWKPTVTQIKRAAFEQEFGGLPDVNVVDCAKRPTAMTLHSGGKNIDISGYQFWIKLGQKFGWDKAPGLRFTLRSKGEQIEVQSTGAGHGVGLCQWGAAAMAKQGKNCEEILQFYLPGTKIRRLTSFHRDNE